MSSTATRSASRSEVLAAAAVALLVTASCAPDGPDRTGTDFETWTAIGGARVLDRARAAPDGTRTADLLDLENGQGFWRQDDRPVAAGEEVAFSVQLWSKGQPEVALQLVNYCTPEPPEVATETVRVGHAPKTYTVRRRFERAQGCVRAQLILTSIDSRVEAWRPRLVRTPPPPPEPAPAADASPASTETP